jgi:hypothetical protein
MMLLLQATKRGLKLRGVFSENNAIVVKKAVAVNDAREERAHG